MVRLENKRLENLNTIIMTEKVPVSKNNDCYFYYYSSCSKGDACPFRHEPSALRNETMCYYWKQGNCSKANCIYRHMEITKKRDRIACYFESQPGGCKKPHCPFQHQNILDHPREEDIKKMPDLILPVKKDAEGVKSDKAVTETKEQERQVIPPSSSSGGTETPPRQVQPTTKPTNPIIVPLQDGESDSESVSGTPQKRRDPDPRLSAQLEWELRRLRQIQAHEANLIGYTFEDDEENEDNAEEESAENEEESEEVVEEVVEVEDEGDAVHRRLHPPSAGIHSRLGSRPNQVPNEEEEDLRHSLLKHRGDQRSSETRKRHKLPVAERLGGVAGRALAETLGTQARKPQVKRLVNKTETLSDQTVKTIAQRLGNQPGALSGRLAGRLKKTSPRSKSPPAEKPNERSLASRIGSQRAQQSEDKVQEGQTKESEMSKSKKQAPKTESLELDFTIKSLADIRAEKQKKSSIQKVQTTNGTKNGAKKNMSEVKETQLPKKENEVKIMTLAEIKAAKKDVFNSTLETEKQKKRAISPISFTGNSPKKLKGDEEGSQISSIQKLDNKEGKTILGTRKLAINRSPVKNADTTTPKVLEPAEPTKILELTNTPVQVKKSSTNISDRVGTTQPDKNTTNASANTPPQVQTKKNAVVVDRMDSFLDEEEALLLGGVGDMLELDDEDIDEAELLL